MKSLTRNESGVALITAILVMMLASGLLAGMYAALMATQRAQATDRDQSVAYAAAHAGLEKLTAGLAGLFSNDFSPSAAQITVVDSTPPTIPGFTYLSPDGTPGYDITFTPIPVGQPNAGDPAALPNADITTGPFEGFKGLITPYVLTVTARSTTGNSEVRLRRELQTVAVPVFQFGIFGDKSLGFHAGPSFDFGGRVHTNDTLFLAQGGAAGNTLTFRDKITAVTQVVRNRLSNGSLITDSGHIRNVSIPTVIGGPPASYRLLTDGESSGTSEGPCLAGPVTTDDDCWTGWKNLSEVTYHANIRNSATGAKLLELPIAQGDAEPIDLIRRPESATEDNDDPFLYGQRYYAQAAMRILLSDRAADITNLPGLTADAPVDLANLAAAGYAPQLGPPFRSPIPTSPGMEPIDPANGLSRTRVSAGAGTATLTIQTSPDWNGPWADGVPSWLTVTGVRSGVTPLLCTTLRPAANQLRNCATPHVALNDGDIVTFDLLDGTSFTAEVEGNFNTLTTTIAFTAAFTTSQQFPAARQFYVGEDPVVCTGYTATTLTGCTWAAGTTLTNNDPVYTGATTTVGTPLISGFLKIEQFRTAPAPAVGQWVDVTMEILNLGFAGPNQQGDLCDDPTPNAIIRLVRLRDNGHTANTCVDGTTGINDYARSLNGTDYYPNMLFDAREGWTRLLATNAGMHLGGLFGYVALDVNNFRRWIAGNIGATGNQTVFNNGYIVYFSDRRGDHDETIVGDPETGEYGHEDSINPGAAAWAQTNALEVGENFNESVDPGPDGIVGTVDDGAETLQTYGATPHPLAIPATVVANTLFDGQQRPWTQQPLLYSARARLARPVLFRRALKLINGGINGGVNSLPNGFTVVAENPIYVQGNYNATTNVTAEPNVPSALIGDSITLLSNAFRDTMTMQYPNDQSNRDATTTGYRFAMVTGKAIFFPKPGWAGIEFGSDGGVHNFMKMLENWGGQTLNYRGSMVSLYYSRQAIGIYRADANVYSPPGRGYNFDSDFLSPPLLPPGTPMFRDINTLKFRQILRPNQ
jgi:hypothetical protein